MAERVRGPRPSQRWFLLLVAVAVCIAIGRDATLTRWVREVALPPFLAVLLAGWFGFIVWSIVQVTRVGGNAVDVPRPIVRRAARVFAILVWYTTLITAAAGGPVAPALIGFTIGLVVWWAQAREAQAGQPVTA